MGWEGVLHNKTSKTPILKAVNALRIGHFVLIRCTSLEKGQGSCNKEDIPD